MQMDKDATAVIVADPRKLRQLTMSDSSHTAIYNKNNNKNNDKTTKGYQGDPSRRYPSSVGFQCGESRRETTSYDHSDNEDDNEDFGFWVTFHSTLPPSTTLSSGRETLEFRCREPSCGVLTCDEPRTTTTTATTTTMVASKQQDDDDDEGEEAVDPFMFEKGYTLAGRTGFQVWPGSRLLVEILTWPIPASSSSSFSRCDYWQTRLREGARVLELGAGVGVVGTSLAATGAQVLLTDLSTLVTHSICPNLAMNSSSSSSDSLIQQQKSQQQPLSPPLAPPAWLNGTNAKPIGRGWAGATALDWTVPVNEQLPSPELYTTIDVVVASDCVWLVSMLDALLSTVASIFSNFRHRQQQHNSQSTSSSLSSDQERSTINFGEHDTKESPSSAAAAAAAATHRRDSGPALLMSFQRRDTVEGDSSAVFTTVQRVLKDVTNRGWTVECLAWSLVQNETEEDKEVFVFEIRPPSPALFDDAPVE
jgi:hypothetical protein